MARSYLFKERAIKKPKLPSAGPSFVTIQKELARKLRTGGITDTIAKHPIGSLKVTSGIDPFDFSARATKFGTAPKFPKPQAPKFAKNSLKPKAPSKASKNGLF